jgi:hypothetical protein
MKDKNLQSGINPGFRSCFRISRKVFWVWINPGGQKESLGLAWIYSGLGLLLLIFFAFPVYVFASPTVISGNPLYPIKRNLEKIEYKLVSFASGESRAELRLADRRLDEAGLLIDKGKLDQNLVSVLKEADKGLARVEAGTKTEIDAQQKKLEVMAKSVGLEKEEVTDVLAISLERSKSTPKTGDKAETSEDSALATTSLKNELAEQSGANKEQIKAQFRECQIEQVEKRVEQKLGDLSESFAPTDLEKLEKNLRQKVDKAKREIKEGRAEEAENTLNTARALNDNAEHFMKPLKEKDQNNNNKNKQKKSHD